MGKISKIQLSVFISIIFLLGACSSTASPKGDVKKESDLTLEEVFEKSQEAGNSLTSVHVETSMKQTFSDNELTGSMEMETSSSSDMILDPLTMHQTTSVNITGEEDTSEMFELMETELYYSNQGMFMKDPLQNEWSEIPADFIGELEDVLATESLPQNQLEQYASRINDFTFEQDEESYILSLQLKDEKANEVLEEGLSVLPDELQNSMGDERDSISLNEIKINVLIDKETFNTTTLDMEMDMTMSVEGEELQVKQQVNSTFSKFNELEEIIIPEDVLNSATTVE
ncbi:DUF6612 family protein [Bacillus spongiae]|uniref:DUF6612 family protein n=1 Tax=Bacillus spongiae TaxID=2683610 RepID=A0ABU8HHC1_9BACI